MITIYWHCLGMAEDERFVAGRLEELAEHLKGEPIKLTISIRRLKNESKLVKEVDGILIRFVDPSYTFNNCDADIGDLFLKFDLTTETCLAKLLVYCPDRSDRTHPLARRIANAAKKEKPKAEWGANCGSFSAVYKPNSKDTVWHEALHLLGLDECYDENTCIRKPDCNCETCVMQYEPPLGVDKNWPSPLCDNLCDKQKEKLREFAKKVEQRCRAKNNS